MALGLPDVRTVRKHGGGVADQIKSKKKSDENKIRGRRRKLKEVLNFYIFTIRNLVLRILGLVWL